MKHNFDRPFKNGFIITASMMVLVFVPGCTWLNEMASDWPPQNEQQRAQQQARAQSATRSADSPGAMAGVQREYRYTQMPEQPKRQERGVNNNMAGPRGLHVDDQSGHEGQQPRGRGSHAANSPDEPQLRQRLDRIKQQLAMLRRDFADIKPVMRKVQAAENQIRQLSRELSQIEADVTGQSGAQSRMSSGNQAGRPAQDARSAQGVSQRHAGRPPMTWQQTRQRARQQAQQQARQRDDSRRQSDRESQPSQQQQQSRGQFRGQSSDRAQQQAGSAYVKDVRTGIFKGNTRLVLDLSRPADFSYDLDNREGLLVVEIEGAGWRAPETQEMPNSDLISSISASTTRQGGSRMVVELNSDAEVVRAQALPPTGNNGHRIFMDLAAQ